MPPILFPHLTRPTLRGSDPISYLGFGADYFADFTFPEITGLLW